MIAKWAIGAIAVCALVGAARAQDAGTLDPKPLPPLAHPNDPSLPAKQVFGRELTPTDVKVRSIGFYARGCLAGAKALPVDGEAWRVMRLSRDRFWGHPAMIAFLERFSRKARDEGIWPGILVGDISQPRGGPMLTGHASHQIGLDADVWLTPMPETPLTRADREEMSAIDMVRPDGLAVDPAHWSERQAGIIRAAAEEPEVERIFVNPAIEKALCERHAGEAWMHKVRPFWGHNYHFHIRIRCPEGETACQPQDPVPPGDGCDRTLAWWFTDEALHPRPGPAKPPIKMAELPPECREVAVEK
ncbi:MAG: penicillin-insensitive murein endopeptidase [Roseiarcus sp.]